MGMDMKINQLPARTWNWLGMNESSLTDIETPDLTQVETDLPEGADRDVWEKADFTQIATGMGPDMDRLAQAAGAEPILVTGGDARLHFSVKDGQKSAQRIDLWAREGEEMNVIMDYTSSRDASGLAAFQTRIRADKNAKVRLVQVQLLGDGCTVLNDIGAVCGENADFQVLQLFLGSEKTYSGCRTELLGAKSSFGADVGYLGQGSRRFDMNYAAVHKGKKTESRMDVSGVLEDESFKLFRGTIDFRNGSGGSKGDEKEDVLLLGDDVVNQTIPLILCGEEDVEGNHGAAIGRLDEELLFYLCSRGLSEEEASNVVLRARMDALCGKIGEERTEKLVQDYLQEVTGNGK